MLNGKGVRARPLVLDLGNMVVRPVQPRLDCLTPSLSLIVLNKLVWTGLEQPGELLGEGHVSCSLAANPGKRRSGRASTSEESSHLFQGEIKIRIAPVEKLGDRAHPLICTAAPEALVINCLSLHQPKQSSDGAKFRSEFFLFVSELSLRRRRRRRPVTTCDSVTSASRSTSY